MAQILEEVQRIASQACSDAALPPDRGYAEMYESAMLADLFTELQRQMAVGGDARTGLGVDLRPEAARPRGGLHGYADPYGDDSGYYIGAPQ